MKSIWHLLEGDSPEESLHIATANSRLDEMRALLAAGVDVNARRNTIMSGQSLDAPLHIAATYGLIEPARLLVESGANLDLIDGLEMTPLMCVCSCDGPPGTDQTALMLAARGNNVPAIEVLVRYGADPARTCRLRWAMGKDAAWMASNEGSIDAYNYLKDL